MKIVSSTLEELEAHAEEAYPEEGCGVLLGAAGTEENEVYGIFRAENENRTDRSRRYLITPETYREADAYAGGREWDVVGVYHSHPDHPARPSETDLDRATFPGFSYVIASVRDGASDETTAWTLAPDRSEFREEPVRVDDRSEIPETA